VVIVVGVARGWEQEGIKDLRTLGNAGAGVVAGGRSFKSCGLSAALVSGVEVAAPDGRTSRPSVFRSLRSPDRFERSGRGKQKGGAFFCFPRPGLPNLSGSAWSRI